MAKQKSVGITIFFVCGMIYARTAFLAPTEEELKDERIAEMSHAYRAEEDPQGLLHGLRYYVLGIGVIGLLIAVEDYFLDKSAKDKPNQSQHNAGGRPASSDSSVSETPFSLDPHG